MAATYTALFYAPEGQDEAAINAALFAAADAVDRQMSGWKPLSDINRLGAAPPGEWVDLPPQLVAVLQSALEIGRASGGMFDIAVGDLVSAWGFGPPERRNDPARIRALTGAPRISAMEGLELDAEAGRARRLAPICLDLSGIAKGYGVDELARCLEAWGITEYLVGIDGEMRGRGGKPGGEPWAVVVELPHYSESQPMGVIELLDRAIATSGDYRNWVSVAGMRLSHTMNPKTGVPLQNHVASVSVLAETCMEADAWATALMVLGGDAGAELARARGMDVLFVLRDGAQLRQLPVGVFA